MNANRPISSFVKGGFFAIFFATGFSALIFQIIWQRVLALHAGVDLYSVTTIVAAFMAGLGLGSLLGGYIADRQSIRNCFLLFFVSNCVIGLFGLFSLWLFYDFYSSIALYLKSMASSFLFHFVVLCIPTTFMGLSLPLLSKALVRTSDEMSSLVGTLYGINTLGAAIGAGLGTWYMMGTFGFDLCIKIASIINIVSGLSVIVLLYRLTTEASISGDALHAQGTDPVQPGSHEDKWILVDRPGVWILIYGLTGFAALSLEIVWFRLLDVITRSTSYTFGHLLFIYLCGLGLGCLIASRIINRIKRPDKFFLWMQYSIGLLSMLCPLVLITLVDSLELKQHMFGFLSLYPYTGFNQFVRYFFSFNLFAMVVFGIATVMMGVCFPMIQRIVSRQMETLGRNLSKLLFSNIVGNILGSIVAGFFFMDYFGTPLTLKIISALLIIPGIVAGYFSKKGISRYISIGLVALVSITVITTFPKEKEFWNFFLPIEAEDVYINEDRSNLSAITKNNKTFRKDHRGVPYPYEVFINGKSQGWMPFGGSNSILGIAPALYHPNPKTGLVIGIGSGDSLYSMALDERMEKVICIELSKGIIRILKRESRREPLWQLDKMFSNPKIEIVLADGRKHLLHSKEKYDLIEIDAFHPFTAYSGNIYSEEFFTRIKEHLNPGGIFCQWIPTSRVENTVLRVFPYVVRFGNIFALASNEPIKFSKAEILERLKSFDFQKSHGTIQKDYLIDYFSTTFPVEIQSGKVNKNLVVNIDLFPKDEYFINNRLDKKLQEPL